ncbi:MAG: nucleotidyltransferase [Gammaproteobacteria bacterium]
MLNEDYKDMLRALNAQEAEFLLIGAYAMAAHGYPRATMDIDLWVRPTKDNAEKVLAALGDFGAPMHELDLQDLMTPGTVFQIGVAPRRIDILTSASGLDYEAAANRSMSIDIEGIPIRVVMIDDLIINKSATGRLKDAADIEALEHLKLNGPRNADP